MVRVVGCCGRRCHAPVGVCCFTRVSHTRRAGGFYLRTSLFINTLQRHTDTPYAQRRTAHTHTTQPHYTVSRVYSQPPQLARLSARRAPHLAPPHLALGGLTDVPVRLFVPVVVLDPHHRSLSLRLYPYPYRWGRGPADHAREQKMKCTKLLFYHE